MDETENGNGKLKWKVETEKLKFENGRQQFNHHNYNRISTVCIRVYYSSEHALR